MTYHKDGSPFQITEYKVVPGVVYYGWLSSGATFEKSKDRQDYSTFQVLADSIKHVMTRGHHHCEFCGWTDADYGNGEMWLEIKAKTYIFPRMIWHYIQQHDYVLPKEIYNSIISGNYEIPDEHKIEQLQTGKSIDPINAPHLVCRAMWKAERYKDMGEFFNKNNRRWNFSQASIQTDYYVVEMFEMPANIDILFADDQKNFPDKISITMEIGKHFN